MSVCRDNLALVEKDKAVQPCERPDPVRNDNHRLVHTELRVGLKHHPLGWSVKCGGRLIQNNRRGLPQVNVPGPAFDVPLRKGWPLRGLAEHRGLAEDCR